MRYRRGMRRLLLAAVLLASGCPSKSGPSPSVPGPAASPCGDLEALAAAAAANFGEQRGSEPVERGGLVGVASTRGVAGAERCAILKPDPAYPDDMLECELAAAGSRDAARAVLAAWTAKVDGCPVVAGWARRPLGDGQSWEQETDDNHLLEIQLDLAGDEPAVTPVIRVRRPEI